MKVINHHNYEEWFFEYFEGNLSKEETLNMIEFIEKDPLYKEDFEAWEKTYIREPLPERLKIESALLRKNYRIPYIIGISAVIALILIYYTTTNNNSTLKDNNDVTNPPSSLNESKKEIKFRNESNATKFNSNEIRKNNIITNTNADDLKGHSDSSDFFVNEKSSELIVLKVPLQKDSSNLNTIIDEIKVDGNKQEKTTEKVHLSKNDKRKLRKIAKLKRKQTKEIQSQKFLKGDQPYVVPTNPNF